jgi:hypothetical protein
MSTPALFNAALFNSAVFGGAVPPGAVIQVGQGLLYPALRKAAITLGPQRTPSPAQFQDAIDELNRLIGSLNCDRLFIYGLDILTFPLQAGKKTYTIGQDPTGTLIADWDAPRPQAITYATVIVGALRYPVNVMTPQEWASIAQQDIGTSIPQALYNDKAYPLSNISIWGQAFASSTIELYTWHSVPKCSALTDAVLLPDGYEDALVLNLACRLAPHFQREVHPDVRQQARESLMRVLSLNAPQPIADTSAVPGGCHDRFNVYRGY